VDRIRENCNHQKVTDSKRPWKEKIETVYNITRTTRTGKSSADQKRSSTEKIGRAVAAGA